MRTEDGHIIRKCLNGDSAAFGFLVDKYKASVYAYVYSRLGNFHDAEDLAQEVFIKAYRNLRKLRTYDSFLGWLYAIASNLCKNWARAQSRRPDSEFIEDAEPDALDNSSISSYRSEHAFETLHEALDSLPDMYRQALTLRYLGGMSSREIARFVGASPAAIRKRLSKARSLLKKELLAAVEGVFDSRKLQAIFTFRIVEAVKDLRIQPMPRAVSLPWGLSLAAGAIIAALSLNPHISMVDSATIPSGSPLPAKAKVLKTGEIPVDIMEISRVSALASRQMDGEDGGPRIPEMQDPVPVAAQGKGDTWANRADMPTGRTILSTSVVNGKIYAVGGMVDIVTGTNSVEEYNPATNGWTRKANMPTARYALTTSVVNGKIYAFGGSNGQWELAVVEEYDPVKDAWTKKADMPTARYHQSTCAVNGRIYAIGGMLQRVEMFFPTVEEYDPVTNTWTRKADMPTARSHLSTSVVKGKIYAIGGTNHRNDTNDYNGLKVVEEYDPATDTWTKKADMPTARWTQSISVVNGKIYVIGGAYRQVPFAVVEEYDPATDTWRSRADMPTAKAEISTSAVNGKIYVIGGTLSPSELFSSAVEEYDPGFVPEESVRASRKLLLPWGKVK